MSLDEKADKYSDNNGIEGALVQLQSPAVLLDYMYTLEQVVLSETAHKQKMVALSEQEQKPIMVLLADIIAKTKKCSATIDAIQLGTGTNAVEKSFQVYEYQLMNADGYIPSERIPQLNLKANSSDVYTKAEIDSMIGDIEDAADRIIALQESYIGGGTA